MKLRVDKSADALYLRLDDSTIAESEEVSPGIVLDYSESGEVVGVEMLRLSRRSSKVKLSTLEFETICGCRTKAELLPFGPQAAEPAPSDPPP